VIRRGVLAALSDDDLGRLAEAMQGRRDVTALALSVYPAGGVDALLVALDLVALQDAGS
jgi:hypothetical protein